MGRVPPSEVVSRDAGAPLTSAAERAAFLADRYPEAREVLAFYREIAEFRGGRQELCDLVAAKGPAPLREAAARMGERELRDAVDRYRSGADRESPASFFARILLRREGPRASGAPANRCPQCGEPSQCGCLRPEGHGTAFFLVCSLCATEWPYPRAQCPGCGEAAVFYASERMDHVQTQVCERCSSYFHVIHLGKEPAAVPLVDEVAALAMDVWALEQGLRKIHPNLAGV